ncbi:methylthioribose kinase 2-like [Acanthaster planci]|uniref:Methylthioribose kinase 2-like n=1 Tax=Acanthaster planci TaxID=133434 RepID=A0A8B7XTF0_ACAPL|nr:methylthioribose kinase 2-like [Acanthaster planci]XP_022083291.1 methylthioribose kinase 2-like [Acanthaster planci]
MAEVPNEGPKEKQLRFDWELLAKISGLEHFGPPSNVTIEAINGGVSNYVYRLTSDKDPSHTVIVKHGESYIRAFPRARASLKRTSLEFWGLKRMEELAPGSVPTPLYYDPGQNFIVMEDLRSYQLLRDQMNHGTMHFSAVEKLSSYLSKLHRTTHKTVVDEETYEKSLEFYKPNEMTGYQTLYLFENPLTHQGNGQYSKEVEAFKIDETLFPNFLKLKAIDKDNHDCLIHGDSHVSSVLVKGSSVKIFDFECARMGPAAADLSNIMAGLIKSYLDHKHYPLKEGSTFHEELRKAVDSVVDTYFKDAAEYLSEKDYTRTISETAGFIGARLVRRVYGLPEMGDGQSNSLTMKGCLQIGYHLLRDSEKIFTREALKNSIFQEVD